MAIEDFFKSDVGKGLALGIGAAILAPVILPMVAQAARPLARAAIKSGIILYGKGREAIAELGEVVEDLMAEAQVEMEEGVEAEETMEPTVEAAEAEVVVETEAGQ